MKGNYDAGGEGYYCPPSVLFPRSPGPPALLLGIHRKGPGIRMYQTGISMNPRVCGAPLPEGGLLCFLLIDGRFGRPSAENGAPQTRGFIDIPV